MISLLFVLINIAVIAIYDIWKMAKSELLYWGYGEQSGAFNEKASDAASISQFALWYFYVITSAFLLFPLLPAVLNIASIVFLHWCGLEDFLYFVFAKWIKLPPKYIETHPQNNICGFGIPVSLYWLSQPRKVGFITIPSLMGLVLGKDIPGKKFVWFVLLNVLLIVVLSIIL